MEPRFLLSCTSSTSFAASGRESAEERLLTISQGDCPAAEYALAYRTLAAQAGWEERPLKLLYRKGLNRELQAELTCRDEGKNLSEFMELYIQIDNLLRTRRVPTRAVPPESTEPMQLGYTHLTPEERARRICRQLCICYLPAPPYRPISVALW